MTQTFCDICGIPIDNDEKYILELTKKVFYKDNTSLTQLIRKMDVCPNCANKIEGYVDYDINEIFEEKGN